MRASISRSDILKARSASEGSADTRRLRSGLSTKRHAVTNARFVSQTCVIDTKRTNDDSRVTLQTTPVPLRGTSPDLRSLQESQIVNQAGSATLGEQHPSLLIHVTTNMSKIPRSVDRRPGQKCKLFPNLGKKLESNCLVTPLAGFARRRATPN